MFSTIIDKENNIYHGYILSWIDSKYFTFAFRWNSKNYIWNCGLDYWQLNT